MNERIAFAAIVILLAANGLMRAGSPEVLAIVGTYTAAAAGETYTLILRKDASAELLVSRTSESPEPARESGAWAIEGETIQVAVNGAGDTHAAMALTLERRGADLVVKDIAGREPHFSGLSFVKTDEAAPSSEEQQKITEERR